MELEYIGVALITHVCNMHVCNMRDVRKMYLQ